MTTTPSASTRIAEVPSLPLFIWNAPEAARMFGAVGLPVKAGLAKGALRPIAVAVSVAKFSLSPRASASSFRVLSAAGEESTRFEICVPT